jgi:peptidoglycan/xylan/chitin deacetylase (PgdA/CDA1 family)
MALPRVLRTLASGRPAGVATELLERLVPGRPDSLAALTFHRVTPPGPDVAPGLLSATPAGFADLLDSLTRHHHVISIGDLLRRAGGGPALPRRAVLLTFDDAYIDFAEHAWPALQERGLPAILFVPTAYPDAPDRTFWWDRLFRAVSTSSRTSVSAPTGPLSLATADARVDAYRALRGALKAMPHDRLLETVDRIVAELDGTPPDQLVLGWAKLRELLAQGVALGPHTRTHPLLPRVEPGALHEEIAGSREELTRMTGSDVPVFAYPSGASSPGVAEAVAAAGLRIAFTTARGVNDLRTASWLALRRINVSVHTPRSLIRAQALR